MQTYVSRELTHFVGRGQEPDDQYLLLVKILRGGCLTHPPHRPGRTGGTLRVSPGRQISGGQLYRTEVVCFCDIPLPLRRIHMNKYSQFGISFRKQFLVTKGACPVWYVAGTSMVRDDRGRETSRAQYFDEKVATYQRLVGEFEKALLSQGGSIGSLFSKWLHVQHLLDFHLLSFIKFFDPAREDRDVDNFYMEREWRVYGNVDFQLSDISTITIPGSYVERLKADVPDYRGRVARSEDTEG